MGQPFDQGVFVVSSLSLYHSGFKISMFVNVQITALDSSPTLNKRGSRPPPFVRVLDPFATG